MRGWESGEKEEGRFDEGGFGGAGCAGYGCWGVRFADLYRRVGEGASVEVEATEFAEAVRGLESEGKVQLVGEGARRMVRRVTGVV